MLSKFLLQILLQVDDIGKSRSLRVQPDKGEETFEIDINININGLQGEKLASGNL